MRSTSAPLSEKVTANSNQSTSGLLLPNPMDTYVYYQEGINTFLKVGNAVTAVALPVIRRFAPQYMPNSLMKGIALGFLATDAVAVILNLAIAAGEKKEMNKNRETNENNNRKIERLAAQYEEQKKTNGLLEKAQSTQANVIEMLRRENKGLSGSMQNLMKGVEEEELEPFVPFSDPVVSRRNIFVTAVQEKTDLPALIATQPIESDASPKNAFRKTSFN